MKTYKNGTQVPYGVYVAKNAIDVRFVGSDNETLDGKSGANYLRLPTALVIAAAPVLGGIFVLAFPVLVLAMVAVAAVKAVGSIVREMLTESSHLVDMRWQPTAAYLNKTDDKDQAAAKKETNPEIRSLEEEIKNRRDSE